VINWRAAVLAAIDYCNTWAMFQHGVMDIFDIQGSGENEYKVHVSPKGEDSVKMMCDCKAGIYGRICKHKLAVATGDPSLLLNPEDAERLRRVSDKIKQREIGGLLETLYAFRKEHDAIKRKMDKARKAVEAAMKG